MRHRAYLVKEQRAAFRQVEISALCRVRTGERAFLVPEEQRGGQLAGQCAAVYGDKRLAISGFPGISAQYRRLSKGGW